MLYRDICRVLANFMLGLSIVLLIPLFVAIYFEWIKAPELHPQPHSIGAFIATIFISLGFYTFFYSIGRNSEGQLYRKEALLLVVIFYFLIAAIGSLPFFLSGTLNNPIDAFFETVSGLTTTGSTVMQAKSFDSNGRELLIQKTFVIGKTKTYSFYGTIEPVIDQRTGKILTGLDAVSKGILFWRSFIQWLGGGGIIVLFVAILPALGIGGKVLYQSEISGPKKDSLAPRIKETASLLWKIYLGLTLSQVALLILTNKNLPIFDAIMIAFSTISTGGFSIKNESIGAYHNVYTELIVLLFMILGGINFSFYFYCMKGKILRLKDPELLLYFSIIIFSCLFASWQLIDTPKDLLNGEEGSFSFLEALRYGSFQVVSAQTSTGFVTANYDIWPFPLQISMVVLMYIGAMAGSTSGGLKVIRIQSAFKIIINKIESFFSPQTVRLTRIGNNFIDDQVATSILTFILISFSLCLIGVLALTLNGLDPETSLTAMVSMINNSGFSFRMGGPQDSFAFLSNFGKLFSSILMVAGRLEFFALLIILTPTFWRKT